MKNKEYYKKKVFINNTHGHLYEKSKILYSEILFYIISSLVIISSIFFTFYLV